VREPRERIVDPLGGERGERARPVGMRVAEAVHDVVVRGRQVRHVEEVAQRKVHRAFLRHRQPGVVRDREMDGHRSVRRADGDRDAVVLDQEADLLDQIVLEKFGRVIVVE
jgi:hypothetical protein